MPHRPSVRLHVFLASSLIAIGLAVAVAPSVATAAPGESAHEVTAADPLLHFTGRWERHYRGEEAATVNSGSAVSLRFTGDNLTGLFDVSTITFAAQVWVTLDDGPRTLVNVDQPEISLAPPSLGHGAHTVRIDVKDTNQVTNRWLPELNTAVVIRGFRFAESGRLLPTEPTGLRMAFYGDSITEGVRALGMELTPDGADGTRAYANLTARAFGADATQVGFGKQGVMREGVGNVPSAPQSFGFNFQGSPADPAMTPDVIVLLQGSNDSKVTAEQFAPAYLDYLRQVRAAAPDAWILAMEPLIGRHADVIRADVLAINDPRIAFVPTVGWLDRKSTTDYRDTVHPTVAGHLTVAKHLVPIVHEITGLPVEGSAALVTVPPVSVAAGPEVTVPVTVHIEQGWNARHQTRGSIIVEPPAGFTVDRVRTPYVVGADGETEVTVVLRGSLAPASSVDGLARVLVDGQTEALPQAFTINAG